MVIKIYTLLPFVLFLVLYCLRLQKISCLEINSKCVNAREFVELNTNLYLKIAGNIESYPVEENGYLIFRIGSVWVKIKKDNEIAVYDSVGNKRVAEQAKKEIKNNLSQGQNIILIGKPEIRVINNFFSQIWLIDPQIELIETDKSWSNNQNINGIFFYQKFFNFIDFIRLKSQSIFQQVLPSPMSGLISGIVLGTSESMDWQFWLALKKTGTLHIVAASGMNVTLVSKVIIDWLVYFISRRKAYFVSLVFIFIYCLLAGASPAVLRAGLMAAFSLLGLAFGRETDSGWLLFMAAAAMLLVNPLLAFDLGFQLSVTAMLGLIYFKPLLAIFFQQLMIRLGIGRKNTAKTDSWLKSIFKNNLYDTLSAQMGTLPILYFNFGQWQPLAFLANLMVIPLVPSLMILGFGILILGLIWLPLAYPLAWVVWPPLAYFVEVINIWNGIL